MASLQGPFVTEDYGALLRGHIVRTTQRGAYLSTGVPRP